MSELRSYAVVVAAGKGTRMGVTIPKQFITFHGMPLMCYAVQAFADAIPGISIVLVVPSYHISSTQIVLRSFLGSINVKVVAGGDTRFESVKKGLAEISDDGIVFIHDGARPLITKDLIMRCFRMAREKGNAVPVIPVTESVRIIEADNSSRTIDRDRLRMVQTPQTFRTEIILSAFKQEYRPEFTDEASVLEAAGGKIYLTEGAQQNIKITTKEDLVRAEALYRLREK